MTLHSRYAALPRWARIVFIPIVLLAIYAILGFTLLPRIIKPKLIEALAQATHRTVEIRELRINPLELSATIRGFAIKGQEGARFVGFEELYVNFELSSIFHRAYTFSLIRLRAPDLDIAIGRDGRYNFEDLLPKKSQAKKESGTPPPILIQQLQLQNGLVGFDDRSRPTPFHYELTALNLTLQNFTTRRDREGSYSLNAETGEGERLHWQGEISMVPLRSHGTLALEGVHARSLWAYMQDKLNFEVTQGGLDAHAHYVFDFDAGTHVFKVTDIGLDLHELHLRDRAHGEDVLVVPRFAVRGMDVDMIERALTIASVESEGAQLRAVRGADGSVDLKNIFTPRTAETEPVPNAQAQVSAPWRVRIRQVQIKNWALALEDQSTQPAAQLRLVPVNLTLTDIAPDTPDPVHVALETGINQGGRLSVTGSATLQPVTASLALHLQDIDLVPFQPYVQGSAHVDVRNGDLSTYGQFEVKLGKDKPQLRYSGDAALRNLRVVDTVLREDFIRWQTLALNGLEYTHQPAALKIREVVATQPYLRMIIAPDKTTNMSHIAVKSEAPIKDQPVTPPSATPPMLVKIAALRVRNGSVNFADQSIQPNFATGIQALNGAVRGLSSKELTRADVDLKGKVDKYAPVMIRGHINPLSEHVYTDLTMSFRGVEMTTFTPYSGKFAGYKVDKGKLNVDLRYLLSQQELKGENKVVIDQLELGERVDSPDAIGLPVRLAIAILKDSNGVIDIDLPVSGRLDDPDFHYGTIVWKAIKNVIVKVATAPFHAIAALIGGDEQNLSYAAYAPGGSVLASAEQAKLQNLAHALAMRPGLRLEVRGTAAELDRLAIAERALRQRMDEMGKGASEVQRLSMLYREAYNEDPQVLVPPPAPGETRTIEQNQSLMTSAARQRLLQAMAVSDDELRALAQTRAEAVQDALIVQGKVDPERIFVLEVDTKAAPAEGEVRIPLTVQAR